MVSTPLAASRLIGRDDESTFLLRACTAAFRASIPSLALIEGAAGIGKSRLIEELRDCTEQANGTALVAQCHEFAQAPYLPFAIALDRMAERVEDARAVRCREGADALDLSVTLPKARRLQTVLASVRALSRQRSLTIVVEDLHWADAATLELLRFLASETSGMAVFIAATYRPSSEPALLQALAQLDRLHPARIRLGPLDEHDTITLLRDALRGRGTLLPERLVRIARLSEGNPLFALELLRNALDGNVNDTAPAIALPTLARLQTLDPIARRVIAAAAVFGAVPADALPALSGLSRAQVQVALEVLVHAELVVREDSRYGFRHALTATAVAGTIAPAELRELNALAAAYLEARGGGEPARLAQHLWNAGDRLRSGRHFEEAGDRALAGNAFADAAVSFERALASAGEDMTLVGRLSEKMAMALSNDGAWEAAAPALERAMEAYRALGDEAGEVRLALLRSRKRWYDGDASGAMDEVRDALARIAKAPPSATHFHLWVRLAFIHQLRSERTATAAALENAEQYLDLGDAPLLIPFFNTRAMYRADGWDVTGCIEDYERTIELAQSIGNVELLASTCNNFALNAAFLGRREIAIAQLERSLELAYQSGMRWHVANTALSFARVRSLFGELQAARALLEEALPAALETPALHGAIFAYGVSLGVALGDRELMERCTLPGVVEGAMTSGDAFRMSAVAVAEAERLAMRGETAAAATFLHWACEALPSGAHPRFFAACAARLGSIDDARRLRAMLDPNPANVAAAAERLLVDAWCAVRTGRRERASSLGREAAVLYQRLGWVLEEARALEAARRKAAALRLYERVGAVRERDRLLPRREEEHPLASCTPREREIVRLVVAGGSNRDVARTLGLSERTVENHLQSAFNRLGIGSRRELAAFLDEAALGTGSTGT